MRAIAASYVAPIFWEVDADEGGLGLRNGTMFFLDAGEGVIAVTAAHVYRGYLDAKERCPQTYCQLGNMRFDPEDRLIACQQDADREPDIATFRVSPENVGRLGKQFLTGQQKAWPPSPPEEGNGVFFAGFPGRDRHVVGTQEVSFGVFHALLVATSVSDRAILCHVDEENLIETPWNPRQAPANFDARGISGAPLITLVYDKGVWSWRLAGVIYKAPEGGGMLVAARADFIRPDGSLVPYH